MSNDSSVHVTDLTKVIDRLKITEVFRVSGVWTNQTSKGKNYYKFTLRNSFGEANAVCWDIEDVVRKNDFIEATLFGQKSKIYGDSWKVSSYTVLPDFEGDSGFYDTNYIPQEELQDYLDEISRLDFKTETYQNLRDLVLEQYMTGANDLLDTPAHTEYFDYKNGLLKYTAWMIRSTKPYYTNELFNSELLKAAALFGHLGSVSCLSIDAATGRPKFAPWVCLSKDPRSRSVSFLDTLCYRATSEGKVISTRSIELLKEVLLLSTFKADVVCVESQIISACHDILVSMNRVAQTFAKMPGKYQTMDGSTTILNLQAKQTRIKNA